MHMHRDLLRLLFTIILTTQNNIVAMTQGVVEDIAPCMSKYGTERSNTAVRCSCKKMYDVGQQYHDDFMDEQCDINFSPTS